MDGHGRLEEPLLLNSKGTSKAAAKNTFWSCAINLSKVITGAGMMAIPRAFMQVGWLPGSTMLIGVAVLTFFSLAVLVQGSAAAQASTYGELVCRTCGRGLMRLLQLAVLLFCFGFSVVYLVVIRDILLGSPPDCNGLLCEAFGPTANIDARLLIIAVAALVCAPLMAIRSMDNLAVLNAAGVAATVLLAVVAAALAAVAAATGQAHPIPMLPQWDQLGHTRGQQWEALTDIIPVILACYVAHQSLHPLMPLLKPYSPQRMLKVVAVALSISCSIFLLLSVGAAAVFGPSTDVNVLNNFSTEDLEPLVGRQAAVLLSWTVRGGYLLCILATLLLYMHPLRSCLAQMLWPDPSEADRQGPPDPAAATAAAVATAATAVAAAAGPQSSDAAAAGDHDYGGINWQQVGVSGRYDKNPLAEQQQPLLEPQWPEGNYITDNQTDLEVSPQERRIWQDLEQAVYYPLTYGLLAAMVLAAVAVTNIFQAVSAVGDIASTMQAFIVPGLIALALTVQQREKLRAASVAAAAVFAGDLEWGLGRMPDGKPIRLFVSWDSVWYAGAGCFVLVLGLALFSNGVYERVSAFL